MRAVIMARPPGRCGLLSRPLRFLSLASICSQMDYSAYSEEAPIYMTDKLSGPLLSVEGLTIEYQIGQEWRPAIRDVHLAIAPNEIHGLVGESGSGKSTLGAGILGDLPRQARQATGHIFFEGRDLTTLTPS